MAALIWQKPVWQNSITGDDDFSEPTITEPFATLESFRARHPVAPAAHEMPPVFSSGRHPSPPLSSREFAFLRNA
jgi:hypothetical protein